MGINFKHVGGLTMIIAALLFVLVNYLLVKNHKNELHKLVKFLESL